MSGFDLASREKWSVCTALKEIYKELVEEKGLFPTMHQLFAAGLAYGLLHNKSLDKKPAYEFTKLYAIRDETTTSVINIVFGVLGGTKDDLKTWNKMLRIADGGVWALNDMYRSSGDINMPALLDEAKRQWPERAEQLLRLTSTGN